MKRQQIVVIVPVKSPAIAKSRLRVPDHLRPGLATAFALDVLRVVADTPRVGQVVVVTADAGFASTAAALGLRTLPDADGLNQSLRTAARAVREQLPDAIPVALCADLPALTSADLSLALDAIDGDDAWFVADADGVGTTLYAASYDAFLPRFGVDSRSAHRLDGAREVTGDLPSLRRDVDDEDSLSQALSLGVGPHTTEALTASLP